MAKTPEKRRSKLNPEQVQFILKTYKDPKQNHTLQSMADLVNEKYNLDDSDQISYGVIHRVKTKLIEGGFLSDSILPAFETKEAITETQKKVKSNNSLLGRKKVIPNGTKTDDDSSKGLDFDAFNGDFTEIE